MGNSQLSPGSLFANRFEIERAAGSGGMGTVYRATDRYSGDTVALKLLHTSAGGHEGERFAREAQILSELRHPGIVAHIGHGQTPDGQRFLAMEWLDGQDLGERLARGPLSVQNCLRIIEQVADALAIAHQRGIIHRDLKPTNLFLVGGDFSHVKILDFGIARRIATSKAMTRTGMVIGTPEYMAPEQARGSRELTPAADLFSLGCVLYECLTGQPPFVADHIAAVLVRILFEEPIPVENCRPGVPAALSVVLGRMLAKHPEQRLADAAALRAELLSLGQLSEPAIAVTMASPQPKVESFADQEQSLFSIVLAALEEEVIELGVTQSGSAVQFAATDRQALLQALAALGGSPDFLANGMLVVTMPPLGSAQDQAALAARAALLIKERWPEAVVSMATGRGSLRGHTAVGEVAEQAARSLKSGSRPASGKPTSGVLLDSLSAKLLQGRFAQTPQPGGALLLYEEREVDASRPLLGKATPCVGRDAELGTLEAQLIGCIEESEARVVLVTAPPGIGKSRLRHEFIRRVEKRNEPITLLLGRGDMMSAGAPYGILRSVIHKLCGISGSEPLQTQRKLLRSRVAQHLQAADAERVVLFIGELCNIPFPPKGNPMLQAARQEPQLMRDALRRALLNFFAAECAAAPVLLLLDDLQWGDALTVAILDEVLREQAGGPLFVLSFARPEVRALFPKLWQSHKMQEISLKGLSKKACERLIVQVLGKDIAPQVIARAIEQSAGNALFLEEIIRANAEGKAAAQSETVVAMLQARLGRLDANARRAVRGASVFGQTFWRGGVLALLGPEGNEQALDSSLEVLTRDELIQRHPRSRFANEIEYGFRHALVRDAAYALLREADQELGNRLAGTYLEKAGELDPMVLAEHASAGRDLERAVGLYVQAATESYQRNDLAGMAVRIERGISCGARGSVLGQLLALKLDLCFWRHDLEMARTIKEKPLSLLPPGSYWWSKAIAVLCMLAVQMGDRNLVDLITEELLTHQPFANALVPYYDAISQLIMVTCLLGQYERAVQFIQQLEAVDEVQLQEDALARGLIEHARFFFRYFLRLDPYPAYQHARRSALAFEQAQSIHLRTMALVSEATTLETLGDYAAAERLLRATLTDALARNDLVDQINCRLHLLLLLAERCHPNELAEVVELADQLTKMTPMAMIAGLAQGVMARVHLSQGRLTEAEAAAEAAFSILQASPGFLAVVLRTRIEARLRLGRINEAKKAAEEAEQHLVLLGGSGRSEVLLRVAIVEAYDAAGEVATARAALKFTLQLIEQCAERIPDPVMRERYRKGVPANLRAQQLAQTILGSEV